MEPKNKIREGEQSKYNTTLDILQHINHLLFLSDQESMHTDKIAHYRRWRILQAIDRTLAPYANKEEVASLEKIRAYNFPSVSGHEWNRSGAEPKTRRLLDDYENLLRVMMARAGFHIREQDDLDDW